MSGDALFILGIAMMIAAAPFLIFKSADPTAGWKKVLFVGAAVLCAVGALLMILASLDVFGPVDFCTDCPVIVPD